MSSFLAYLWSFFRRPRKRLRAGDSSATISPATSAPMRKYAGSVVAQAANFETLETEIEDEEMTGQTFAEIADDVPPEVRVIRRMEKIFQIIKIAFLFLLWMAMTFILMTTVDNEVTEVLVHIPAGETFKYTLESRPEENAIGIKLRGPFVPQINESMYHEPLIYNPHFRNTLLKNAAPQWILSVVVQAVQVGEDKTVTGEKHISKIWQIELPDPLLFDEVAYIKRDELLKLDDFSETETISLQFSTNDAVKIELALEAFIDTTPVPELWGLVVSFIILVVFYFLLCTGRVNRILLSMIASTVVVSVLAEKSSRPSMAILMTWVEAEMLMMIFGVTIIMGFFVQSGVFDWIAVYSYEIFNGHIWPPINTLCIMTFLLCSIFEKMTVVLMMTPVSTRLCEVMEVNPVPAFVCIICFSNIGSIWTLTAAEENALITTHSYLRDSGVSQSEFIAHMLPGVLLISIQSYLHLRFSFRDIRNIQFQGSPEVMKLQRLIKTLKRTADTVGTFTKDEKAVKKSLLTQIRRMRIKLRRIAKIDKPSDDFKSTLASLKVLYPLRDKVLLVKCCIVTVLIMIFFLIATMSNWHYLTNGWVALLGALMLLILADMENMEEVLLRVEWGTCMFFATLFIVMQGVIRMGLTKAIGEWSLAAILYFSPEYRFAAAIVILIWISGISSIFIWSVPIANTMVHMSIIIASNNESSIPLQPLVWALTFGTCLGNNGTLISGLSNVVCAGLLEHQGYKFRFKQYLKIGIPITIGGLLVATIYLWLCHIVGSWH